MEIASLCPRYVHVAWTRRIALPKLDSRTEFIGLSGASRCGSPTLPVKSAADLIALAQQKPGEIRYGSSGIGNITHLAAELFNMMAGTKMLNLPCKGGGPVMIDLLAGRVRLLQHRGHCICACKSRRLRAIGAATSAPSAAFPDVPSVAKTGLPGYEVSRWYAILVPAATSRARIDRLNKVVRAVLSKSDVQRKLRAHGVETVDSSPAAFQRFIAADIAKWAKVIKAINRALQ